MADLTPAQLNDALRERDEARAALQNLLHAHQCRCSACLDAAAILHGAQEPTP